MAAGLVRELAPAKANLVLQVGRRRPDGLHDIASLFASIDLADQLTIEPAVGGEDEVICPGVPGDNIVTKALGAFRTRAELAPLRVTIAKLIPVAAGLGGGSADAAAALRAANAIAGHPFDADGLRALGMQVGADVPSQVEPRHALITGAGEHVEPVELPDMVLVLVPADEGLSTAAVYAEADRIPSTRPKLDPDSLRALATAPLAAFAKRLENDLEPAALALRPELTATLTALLEAGALAAQITGSGPTAFGVFESEAAAGAAAALMSNALVTPLRNSNR
jgi:4-diphosphocytidyl-2-C-methyl-D-erythritol kinase